MIWTALLTLLAGFMGQPAGPGQGGPGRRSGPLPAWAIQSWMMRAQLEPPVLLAGGTVVDVRHGVLIPDTDVLIIGDTIREIGAVEAPPNANVIDVTGSYIIPGLIDLHAHAQPIRGNGTANDPLAEQVMHALVSHGVTTIRLLPYSSEFGASAAGRAATDTRAWPGVVPASSIFEQTPQRTSLGFGDAGMARAWTDREAALGTRWIKVYNAMDEPSLGAIIEAAESHGMRVCGHAEGVPADRAAALGMHCVEHITSIPPALVPEDAVPPAFATLAARIAWGWAHADDADLDALMGTFREHGMAWVPTLVVTHQMAEHEPRPGLPAMTDAERASLRDAVRRAAELAVEHHRAGGLVGLGTDFPVGGLKPGASAQEEVRLLVELGGATPAEALAIATVESARVLGLDATLGTAEPGKLADLVILDRNPLEDASALQAVRMVIRLGRVVVDEQP
ncbi:MAG: amidohydrolase [Phycisphaeraceae bacterium]|nr:MAG: amidohydrolase [Phycisphaeraceae bacterium]